MPKAEYPGKEGKDCFNTKTKWEPEHNCRPAVKVILFCRFFQTIFLIGLVGLVGKFVNDYSLLAGAPKATGQAVFYIVFAALALANCLFGLPLFYIMKIKWMLLAMFILDTALFITSCICAVESGSQVAQLICSKEYYARIPVGKTNDQGELYTDLPYIPNAFPVNPTFPNWFHGSRPQCMESKAIFGLFCCVTAAFFFSCVAFGVVFGLMIWKERKGTSTAGLGGGANKIIDGEEEGYRGDRRGGDYAPGGRSGYPGGGSRGAYAGGRSTDYGDYEG